MLGPGLAALGVVTGYVALVQGQATWSAGQVSTSICYWEQPRAAVIRDTVYLDGGNIWWMPVFSDGQVGPVVNDDNPLGIIYTLNFSTPFNTTQNITALFGTISKAPSGGAANNLAPNYLDGGMLANDAEFFLYGGLLRYTAQFSATPGDQVLGYQLDQYGVQKDGFMPGPVYDTLPSGMTRYVTYGGAASAPSENKAWYFGGLRSPIWGPIYETGANTSLNAVNVSNRLITLDMTTQQQEKWANDTLPSSISGRANPELVWVPVGSQGILVALGGVTYPDFSGVTGTSLNITGSEAESPAFMSTIDIYDVAGGKWYKQPTTGGPGQTTRGCAVVAPAQDRSSYNIYYYGGYSGLNTMDPFSDVVWVLSLPSFTWTKIASTSPEGFGRAGHKCFMPYPDQMMVIGGYTNSTGTAPTCLTELIMVFNLTTGTWIEKYDPSIWSKYSLPGAVVSKIGGSGTGSATLTTPAPSGWATKDLSSVFATSYPTSKITTYYPYPSVAVGNNTNPNAPTNSSSTGGGGGGGGGVPAFLPPVLGVVLGLMVLTMAGVLILLWRRRRLFKPGRSEAGETEDTNGHRIISWMRGQTGAGNDSNLPPAPPKSPPTVTTATDDTAMTPSSLVAGAGVDMAERGQHHDGFGVPLLGHHHPHVYGGGNDGGGLHEAMDTQVYPPVELMDTSPRAELENTGLSHIDVIGRYSHLAGGAAGGGQNDPGLGTNNGLAGSSLNNNPSYYSNGSPGDQLSTVSHSSAGVLPAHTTAPQQQFRPDSDPLGNGVAYHHYGAGTGTHTSATTTTPTTAGIGHTAASSPTLPNQLNGGSPGGRGHVQSEVSNLSERDRTHLRQISDATVSSVTSGGGDRVLGGGDRGLLGGLEEREIESEVEAPTPILFSPGGGGASSPQPVSPPTAGIMDQGVDYLSARPSNNPSVQQGLGLGQGQQQQTQQTQGQNTQAGTGTGTGTGSGSSPISRRSIFHESREDMNGPGRS